MMLGAATLFLLGSRCAPKAPTEANEFFERKVALTCEKNAECCHADMSTPDTRSYCLETTAKREKLGFVLDQLLETALSANRVVHDAKAEDACFAAIRGLSCEAWQQAIAGTWPEPCTRIFAGSRQDGESCSSYLECVSQYCEGPASGGSGVCKPQAGEGSACVDAAPMSCQNGLDCSIFGQSKLSCVKLGLLGDSCVDGEQCYSRICEAGTCTEGCWSNPLSHQIAGL